MHFLATAAGGVEPIPPMTGTTTKEEGVCHGWVWAATYLREELLRRVWLRIGKYKSMNVELRKVNQCVGRKFKEMRSVSGQ